jgi:hypothetical protein
VSPKPTEKRINPGDKPINIARALSLIALSIYFDLYNQQNQIEYDTEKQWLLKLM